MTALSYLDLNDNAVESGDLSWLTQLTALQFLHLSTHLQDYHEPANLDALTDLSLRTLLVLGLNLHGQGQALAAMTGLRRLHVDGKGLDAAGVRVLPELTRLTHLTLTVSTAAMGSWANGPSTCTNSSIASSTQRCSLPPCST